MSGGLGTEADLAAARDAFAAAAVGAAPWIEALERLAEVTGSRSGQLIGVGADTALPFNWATNIPLEGLETFAAMNGGDPRINPRVRAGLASRELEVVSEADFITESDLRGPMYAGLFDPFDVPHTCQTTIVRRSDFVIGLSVLRTRKEGPISFEQRRVFTALAPHVQSAVRAQMALRSQGAALVAGAMGGLSMAVFVCDARGRVQAMSPQAEAVAADGAHLRLQRGRLSAWSDADTRALEAALHEAAFGRPGAPGPATTLVVRDASGVEPVLVEVARVPGEAHSFGFGVAALVVVRGPRRNEARAAALARVLFGLTQAETAVVGDLVAGHAAGAIADRAGVSVATVRTHIKHVLEKAGASSQLELISLITARL